jgi:pimeloyl-ACP methyl ester carboxylesterase
MIDQLYEGMALSVLAAEDLPLMSEEMIESSASGTFLGPDMANEMRIAAALWPQARLDPSFWEPVKSDVPVLLISGSLDPVTPPHFAQEATSYLSNSLHLVFPHGSHGDAAFRPCMDHVLEAFYRTGTVEGLDTSCVVGAQPVPFMVR